MSRKNHKMIDGRLLQTNKKYSQLKMKQKEKIAEWMFQATRDYYMKKCTFPSDKHLEEVVDSVYEKIEDAEIWIPYGEVFKHYKSKRSDINKRVRKSLNEKEESQIEKVCFMNMCMIQDHKGNVLALDKVNDSYTGTTFPGGHVEANEIFQKSMIREVWEETGLTVEAPKLGGLYHWHMISCTGPAIYSVIYRSAISISCGSFFISPKMVTPIMSCTSLVPSS